MVRKCVWVSSVPPYTAKAVILQSLNAKNINKYAPKLRPNLHVLAVCVGRATIVIHNLT